MNDYVKPATKYAKDVVKGKILACKWVKLACQRQIDDLKAKDFGYTFDHDRANRVCNFIENLPHIKGKWGRGGGLIKLEPWQCFMLTTLFGWVDSEGNRRYKTAYIEVPRKNAKSTIASAVGLYCLCDDDEQGAEVFAAAAHHDQAREVFDVANKMVNKAEPLRDWFGVVAQKHSIFIEETASSFRALSSDKGGSQDGHGAHCALIDELHAHKTRDMFDALDQSTGSREQPLIFIITTAGSNRAGICYEQRAYILKVLQGLDEPEIFGIVYTIDDDDDWADESSWIKANPNWGVSVIKGDLRRQARKAMEMASAQNTFLTKRLNVWVNADTAWMDMRAWDACGDPSLSIDDFKGDACIAAFDLATKIDFAAKARLFKRDEKYYVFMTFYLPEDRIESASNSQYQGWARDGRIVATDGNTIDIDLIEDGAREDAGRFQLTHVQYDPWQATQFANHLVKDGLPMLECFATVRNFSEAMKELERLVLTGKLAHTGCPIMSWMISNVVCHTDAKDNIYPRKEFPDNKIDGPVALIMAIAADLTKEEPPESMLEKMGGIVYVG